MSSLEAMWWRWRPAGEAWAGQGQLQVWVKCSNEAQQWRALWVCVIFQDQCDGRASTNSKVNVKVLTHSIFKKDNFILIFVFYSCVIIQELWENLIINVHLQLGVIMKLKNSHSVPRVSNKVHHCKWHQTKQKQRYQHPSSLQSSLNIANEVPTLQRERDSWLFQERNA